MCACFEHIVPARERAVGVPVSGTTVCAREGLRVFLYRARVSGTIARACGRRVCVPVSSVIVCADDSEACVKFSSTIARVREWVVCVPVSSAIVPAHWCACSNRVRSSARVTGGCVRTIVLVR